MDIEKTEGLEMFREEFFPNAAAIAAVPLLPSILEASVPISVISPSDQLLMSIPSWLENLAFIFSRCSIMAL